MAEDRAWRKDVPKNPLDPWTNNPRAKEIYSERPELPVNPFQHEVDPDNHLSSEQFSGLVEAHPELGGHRILHTFFNHLNHLHNSLLGQNPTSPGMLIDNINGQVIPSLDKLQEAHAVGAYPAVHRALNAAHALYSEALTDPDTQKNKAFLDSYTGMHLHDLVHTTLPKLANEYKETLGV
jgi:hypothetical protein